MAGTNETRDVIATLQARGLVSQITESGLDEALASGSLTVYCGFDASYPSLQIGNLVPMMALAHFQRAGHRPIVVVGAGTGMIGDPSGKSSERNLLSMEQVVANAAVARRQLERYLDFTGPHAALMVNNLDWLAKVTLIEYLRDIGKHFSVNAMMAKESVRARLESDSGISYTEFSYMIVQALDFLRLYEDYGCTVQIGGHDQWGNLTAGVDLIRRVHGVHVHALTVPLITSASGAKFGKSDGNALYLDSELTTPYELYQYWINIDDRDVGRYLRIFTFLPLDEIAEIERAQAENPASRSGQKLLAFEVTQLIHGEQVAREVASASGALFGEGVAQLTPEALPHLEKAIPTAPLPAEAFSQPLVEALVTVGAQPSRGAARRLMQQGGVYVNDQRWSDVERALSRDDLLFGHAVLVRIGKNKYHLLLAGK
jgi:tyrosyl-tRNA synthetase